MKIFEKFHELPDALSGKQYRFFVFINYTFLVAGLFHFAFIWIFALLDLTLLSIYNVFSSALWGVCIYLNLQGRRVVQLLLANAEVLIHAGLCVAILGWNSGFHYFVLAAPLIIFLSPWLVKFKIALCVLNCIAYALMFSFTGLSPHQADIPATHVAGFNYVNITSIFFVIAIMAFYYRRSVLAAEEKLAVAHEHTTEALIRLSENLSDAAVYLQTILPEPIEEGPIRSHWGFIPSESLGGDAFGYNWLDDDHFAVYLLDVSGHGVSAALLSATITNVLRSTSLPGVDFFKPAQVLSALNRAFPSEANNDMFFTIWYGVYDNATRRLIFASGGHPPALLMPNGSLSGHSSQRLGTPNHIVGGFPDSAYRHETRMVETGSCLYVFSDGVYEFLQPDGKRWHYGDFKHYLDHFHSEGGHDFEALIRSIKSLNRADVFEDDFTLLRVSIN